MLFIGSRSPSENAEELCCDKSVDRKDKSKGQIYADIREKSSYINDTGRIRPEPNQEKMIDWKEANCEDNYAGHHLERQDDVYEMREEEIFWISCTWSFLRFAKFLVDTVWKSMIRRKIESSTLTTYSFSAMG